MLGFSPVMTLLYTDTVPSIGGGKGGVCVMLANGNSISKFPCSDIFRFNDFAKNKGLSVLIISWLGRDAGTDCGVNGPKGDGNSLDSEALGNVFTRN